MKELIVGCGWKGPWEKNLKNLFGLANTFEDPTTLDYNKDMEPDIQHNLNETPYPLNNNTFDEVHAYEVLEHLGRQGDVPSFFVPFNEIWRILKPNGILVASVPRDDKMWAWGDPGHVRVINQGSLLFLSSSACASSVSMMDYRKHAICDFEVVASTVTEYNFIFVLRAIK